MQYLSGSDHEDGGKRLQVHGLVENCRE
ncbi:hypothetical protein [Mycobacterium lepromatosis]